MQVGVSSRRCNSEHAACSPQLNAQVKMPSPVNDADIRLADWKQDVSHVFQQNLISGAYLFWISKERESLTFK